MKIVRWASIKPDGKYEHLNENGRWVLVSREQIDTWFRGGIVIHYNPGVSW